MREAFFSYQPGTPQGMPRYIKSRGGALQLIHFKLSTERCWLLIRGLPEGDTANEELILTPACQSTEEEDEDTYLTFLKLHGGWEDRFSAVTEKTENGRPEHIWFDPPKNLRDQALVLETIARRLKEFGKDGEILLKIQETELREGSLRLVFDL